MRASENPCISSMISPSSSGYHKELIKEQQSTRPLENEEQTTRHVTPHKQYKRGPHTEEWKLRNSLLMRRYWGSVTEDERQEFVKRVRKYDFDDHAFDKLSADAKYWIGYMMARVSIIKRKKSPRNVSFKFSVPKEDCNHLERFNKFIKSTRPVGFHKKKNVCELEIRSRKILDELAIYGIYNNMRYNEKVSKLEGDRAFIDGNASGRSGKFEISMYRSGYGKISLRIKKGHELILQFKTFVESILGHSIGEPKPEKRNWSLTITDRNVVELYLKLLYDKNSIALDSNLKKIEQILSLPEYKTKNWVKLSLIFRKYFTHR